jgi:glycosyltransferase involved in cell wall biosynthesis
MYTIGFMAGHACVRVQKMALPLMDRGHRIYMASQKVPSFANHYDCYTQTASMHQLRNWVKIVAEHVDLFHVHNEPSWFVTLVKEQCDKPVILDVHDSFLARITPEQWQEANDNNQELVRICVEERNNFQLADGLVFCSRPFGHLIKDEFGLSQPYTVVPSYLPQNLFQYANNSDWYGGLVYEGRVDLVKDIEAKSKFKAGFQYTNYEAVADKCKELGIDFHIYARQDSDFLEVYGDKAICHKPVGYDKLLGRLARHDWGLVGNSFPTPEWKVAEPNKLYEYVAAGTPVVAMNADHCADIVRKDGIGIVVESLEELRDRWSEHEERRRNLLKVRGKYAMEEHLYKLENLYERVLTWTK